MTFELVRKKSSRKKKSIKPWRVDVQLARVFGLATARWRKPTNKCMGPDDWGLSECIWRRDGNVCRNDYGGW